MSDYIYIFSNSYKPVLGGVQTVTSQLAEGFIRHNIKCKVITNLYPKTLKMYEVIDMVPVVRLPFSINGGNFRNRVMFLVSFLTVFILFTINRPRIVYVHFPIGQVDVINLLHKIFKFRLITCFHGHDVLRYDEGYSKNSRMFNSQCLLVKHSDVVTACSNYLCSKIKTVFNVECTPIAIYNGVDLGRYIGSKCSKSIKRPFLFAWGRLEKIKGYDILIKAFSKLDYDIDLLIAGEGSQRAYLEKLIAELSLNNRVQLLGKLSPDDIVLYSKASLINIIPSLRESFGIVLLEAIAAGRPIICTNSGGLPEIMRPQFGIMCKSNDSNSLREAIINIISGRYITDFTLKNEYLQRFSVDRMLDAYYSLSK